MTNDRRIEEATPTSFLKSWLIKDSPQIVAPGGITYSLLDVNNQDVTNQMKLLITYMCRNPLRIIDKIEQNGLQGFFEAFRIVMKKRMGFDLEPEMAIAENEMVWRGTIGEVLATGYIIEFADFIVPVLKLRTAHNEAGPLSGDDILGFKFTNEAEPKALLVCEAKFKSSGMKQKIKEALKQLANFQKYGSSLMNFIIEDLYKTNIRLAHGIERFYDEYNYRSVTSYMIFGVTDKSKFDESHLNEVDYKDISPLDIVILGIPQLQNFLSKLKMNTTPEAYALPEFKGVIDPVEDAEKLLSNEDFKNDTKKLASAVLSINLNIPGKDLAAYKIDASKIMNAAHLLSTVAIYAKPSKAKREDLLERAAKLYEHLFIWYDANSDTDNAINAGLLSSVAYSVAGYGANSRVLAEKINKLKSDYSFANTGNLYALGLSTLIGHISLLEEEIARILFFAKDRTQIDQNFDEELYAQKLCEAFRILAERIMARIFMFFSDFLRRGTKHLEKIEIWVQQALIAYGSIGDYTAYHFAILLLEHIRTVFKSSPWNIIPPTLQDSFGDKWRDYISSFRLGRFPMITLWASQKQCIAEGLLGEENLIITMPTSAGKTRTVEMAIFDALSENPNHKCAYIVPTRALATEVEESLSDRLGRMGTKISVLYGGYDTTVAEEDIISEAQVFVLTMEKFDMLSRQESSFFENIKLLIIDEAHEIASSSKRSLRAELIMARMLRIIEKRNIRLLLLSAVVKNPDDFQKWIDGSKISSSWSPTSQRYGYFDWFRSSATIQYFDEIEEKYSEFVPLGFKRRQLIHEDKFRIEVAARLGIFFANIGNTLIFVSNKGNIVNDKKKGVVDHILRLLGEASIAINSNNDVEIERSKLAQSCASIVGDEHVLVTSIKKGVCYHKGDLPRDVRKIVEKGIRDGLLPLVVSTTTLSKGVNLPLKNCIVQSLGFPQKMPVTEFENAVGRAGRAGFETEGHIIFCHRKDLQYVARNQQNDKSISFIASGIYQMAKLRLPSLFENELTEVEKWAFASTKTFRNKDDEEKNKEWKPKKGAKIYKEEILSIIDAELLAYVIEEAIEELDKNAMDAFWGKTLCAVQSLDLEEQVEKLKSGFRSRFLAIKAEISDEATRKLFNITGLGIKGNQQISRFADDLIRPDLPELVYSENPPANFWSDFFETIKEIPEFTEFKNVDENLLIKWIDGIEYASIAEEFSINLEETIVTIEKAVFAIPWATTALVHHLKSKVSGENIPEWLANVSSLAMHGVPNIVAVYMINLGVRNRQCAIGLANKYLQNNNDNTFEQVKKWLYGLTKADFFSCHEGLDEEIVLHEYDRIQEKKIYSQTGGIVRTFNVSQVKRELITETDSLKVVRLEGEFWVVNPEFKRVCKFDNDALNFLRKIDLQKKDLIINSFNEENEGWKLELIVI